MPSSREEYRQCPTRLDGADPLIAHQISPATCQGRKSRHYHKCHDCVHRCADAALAVNGAGAEVARRVAGLEKAPATPVRTVVLEPTPRTPVPVPAPALVRRVV
jgi:hypothetical protein